MTLIRLAWRNLFRNRRRTGLTAAAGAFAAFLTIFSLAMARGSHERWVEQVVRLYPGHYEVSLDGYRDNRTLDYGMELESAHEAALDRLPETDGWAPRLEAFGLLMPDDEGATGRAAWLVGIDATREAGLSTLSEKVSHGRFVERSEEPQVVLGAVLAENLGVETGDRIILLASDYYGSQSADRFRVVGTIEVGNPEFDAHAAFVELGLLQEFLEVGAGVSHVAVFASDSHSASPLQGVLAQIFPETKYELLNWEQLVPDVMQFMVLDDIGNWLLLAILIVVVGFGLLNTILMSVFERVREFGVLRAVGLRPRAVFQLVVIESVMLSMLGVAIGMVIAIPCMLWLEGSPIPMSAIGMDEAAIDSMRLFDIEPVIMFDLTVRQVWSVPFVLFVVGLLAALPPAIRASRGRPVDALREA